jgi:hypothetical protein
MIQFIKDKVTDHFEEILLGFLFLATVLIAVHLMHKSDAGGDDAGFIVWAETQAAMILGKLIGMIGGGNKPSAVATTTTATALPNDEKKETP